MVYYIGSIPCAPSDIQHFGIKGMKWGVRRFRNTDGSLTDAGKARYKNPKDMSDKELKDAVQRLSNEKQYKQLIKELDKKPVSRGAKAVGKLMSFIGNKVIGPFTESAIKSLGKALGDAMADAMADSREDDDEQPKKKNKTKSESKTENRSNASYTTKDFGERPYRDDSTIYLPPGKKKRK